MRNSASPKSGEDIQGYEYDWLGCDEDGFVALFSTAGGGYAPPAYLRDTDSHARAIDALLALPVSTSTSFHPSLAAHLENTWKLVAERGLYAYDSDPHGGPYHLVAAPEIPIRLDALPSLAANVVAEIRLTVRFSTSATFTRAVLMNSL